MKNADDIEEANINAAIRLALWTLAVGFMLGATIGYMLARWIG